MEFDNLIRKGQDTDALRYLADEYYKNGKIGHTRKLLLERVADKYDKQSQELAKLRAVAEAARAFENQYNLDPFIDDVTPGTIAAHRNIRQALAELDKEGER